MYVNTRNDLVKGQNVTVVGKVARIDGRTIYLSINNQQIPVVAKNVASYASGVVAVTGIVDMQGNVIEEKIVQLEEDLDTNLYNDFVEISKKFPEIF